MAGLDGQMTIAERISWCSKLRQQTLTTQEHDEFSCELAGLEGAEAGSPRLDLKDKGFQGRYDLGYQNGMDILRVTGGLDPKRSDG